MRCTGCGVIIVADQPHTCDPRAVAYRVVLAREWKEAHKPGPKLPLTATGYAHEESAA